MLLWSINIILPVKLQKFVSNKNSDLYHIITTLISLSCGISWLLVFWTSDCARIWKNTSLLWNVFSQNSVNSSLLLTLFKVNSFLEVFRFVYCDIPYFQALVKIFTTVFIVQNNSRDLFLVSTISFNLKLFLWHPKE